MVGSWRCTDSDRIQTTVGDPSPIRVDDQIILSSNAILYRLHDEVRYGRSRAGYEKALGFPLDWYTNQADGHYLTFGFGWTRFNLPTGPWVGYQESGLRLAVIDANTLRGYQASTFQSYSDSDREKWIYELRFERMMDSNADGGEFHQQVSIPDIPIGTNEAPPRSLRYKR
jgi:hypothetical protein